MCAAVAGSGAVQKKQTAPWYSGLSSVAQLQDQLGHSSLLAAAVQLYPLCSASVAIMAQAQETLSTL